MLHRSIDRVTVIPPLGPGFDGERHKAALVVAPGNFHATDPFFLMADDHITLEGRFGEAHPHAGLETVTFMLNGMMEDTGGRLAEGDVEWMTAGSGIVHSEDAMVSTGMRLFQLWLVLPEEQRNMPPRVQILKRAAMPVHVEPGSRRRSTAAGWVTRRRRRRMRCPSRWRTSGWSRVLLSRRNCPPPTTPSR